MFLVMGLSLLGSVAFVLVPAARRHRSNLRDTYWVLLSIVVLSLFGVALLMEGAQRVGWTQ